MYLMHVSPSVSHPCIHKIFILPYDLPSNASPRLIYRTPSGFKPAYQLEVEALGWDVCLYSHFLPFQLQQQAHSHSRTTSWLVAFPQITLTARPTFRLCQLLPPPTKQPFYAQPEILHDISVVESGLQTPIQQAAFKAAVSSQWKLAVCAPNCLLWPAPWWRSGSCHRCTEAWSLHVCSTPMSLWVTGWCPWGSQFHLQEGASVHS